MIYAIAALVAVTLFSVSIRQTGLSTEQEMYVNEARTRMLAVARESVERISRLDLPFDYATDPDRGADGKEYPYVDSPSELTPADNFGYANCSGDFTACLDVDDYHGFAIIGGDANGMPYDLGIEVAYVDTLDGSPAGSQTFAKTLTVTVSTPAVQIGGEPASVSYTRIYAYPSVMDFARGAESML